MSNLIQLRVPRYDLNLDIELLPNLAPVSAALLQVALPAVGLVTTESYSGSNITIRLPNFRTPLAAENVTVYPIPGDVFLFEREHGVELVAYLQRNGGVVPAGTPHDSRGNKAGNRVGHITNLTQEIWDAGWLVWQDGAAWGAASSSDSAVMQSIKDDQSAAADAIERRRDVWHKRTWRDHIRPAGGEGKCIRLVIPEYDASTTILLDEQRAPQTCASFLEHAPLTVKAMHGRFSGPEIYTNYGEVAQHWQWQAVPENQTTYPIPGDMILYIHPSPRLQPNYFHDRDAVPYGMPRPEPGNLVGSSAGDFNHFAEACWRMNYEGWKTLIIEQDGASST
jgi:hypothetical protein